jgi:NtrC-family two-component system response regulator AlgB
MNTMIDGTSLDVLQQRAVEARDTTQALLRCGELDQPPGTLLPEVELQTREPRMREALDVAFKTAASEATILLRGESGAGKEVLARAIHARSPRAARPLATLHCPGLSAELLESELFGHVQGACPGAAQDTVGKVAVAEGGTLFLSEIGDLPPALQPRLLRLLQEHCYERVGESQTRASDIRVVAATSRNLEAELAAGRFLEDLYYQLNVVEVTVPSLRDRPADILPLAEHLLRSYARQDGKSISGFDDAAREALLRYAWPGNIRELRNVVERGTILAAGPLVVLADLPSQIGSPNHTGPGPAAKPQAANEALTLEQMEAEHIRRILASAASIGEAAAKLGIDPSTLYRKRKRYGI